MQEKVLYEYAVIRIVPQVEREEFLNVGVILYCAQRKFLACKIHLNTERLSLFSSTLDPEFLKENLQAICLICEGHETAGPIGKLDMASRFRWLTATRSTVIQTSKVHPGYSQDLLQTLSALNEKLVF